MAWATFVGAILIAITSVTSSPVRTGIASTCLVETNHPYLNNAELTATLFNPGALATATRIHFSQFDTQADHDFVIIRDANDVEIQRLSGLPGGFAGFWSSVVPGRVVKVQFNADSTVTAPGFCVDSIESATIASVPSAADDCKKDGWKTRTRADGSQFKNQGDCVQYVNTGK